MSYQRDTDPYANRGYVPGVLDAHFFERERGINRWALVECRNALQNLAEGQEVSKTELKAAICAADFALDICSSPFEVRSESGWNWAERRHTTPQRIVQSGRIVHRPGVQCEEKTTRGKSLAAVLPPELLRAIFAFAEYAPRESATEPDNKQINLYACTLVNRHWNTVAMSCLWRNPDISSMSELLRLLYCCRLGTLTGGLSMGGAVTRLDLLHTLIYEPYDTHILLAAATHLPNIRELRLQVENLQPRTVTHIFQSCKRIEVFAFRGFPSQYNLPCQNADWDPWDLAQIENFVDGLGRLKALCLHDVKRREQSLRFYDAIAVSLSSNLRRLNLGRTWVNDEIVRSIAERCPLLEMIYLEENLEIRDAGIVRLAECCPELRVVKLRNCIGVGDEALTALAHRCPKLEVLGLSYTRCTDESFKVAADFFQNLRVLYINDLWVSEDVLIEFLRKRGAQLRTLGMSGCDVISQDFIFAMIEYCQNLEELDISSCGNPDEENPITEATVDTLIEGCPRLRTLLVSGNDKISAEYLDRLANRVSTVQFWMEPADSFTDL